MQVVTEDMIRELAARDDRVGKIELGLDVCAELERSKALQIVFAACQEDAVDALERLAVVDPHATSEIIALQATVFRSRFTASTLNAVIERGRRAEMDLVEDA